MYLLYNPCSLFSCPLSQKCLLRHKNLTSLIYFNYSLVSATRSATLSLTDSLVRLLTHWRARSLIHSLVTHPLTHWRTHECTYAHGQTCIEKHGPAVWCCSLISTAEDALIDRRAHPTTLPYCTIHSRYAMIGVCNTHVMNAWYDLETLELWEVT